MSEIGSRIFYSCVLSQLIFRIVEKILEINGGIHVVATEKFDQLKFDFGFYFSFNFSLVIATLNTHSYLRYIIYDFSVGFLG